MRYRQRVDSISLEAREDKLLRVFRQPDPTYPVLNGQLPRGSCRKEELVATVSKILSSSVA